MESASAGDRDAIRSRRRQFRAVQESLREMTVQVSLLQQRVGSQIELRVTDLDCLDLITRLGPLSPSALARRAGVHPATLTGILDRLERGGWIARDRDPADRRGVTVRALRDRTGEVTRLYSGMTTAMTEICAGYSAAELELLAGFLHAAAQAGQAAAEELTARSPRAARAAPATSPEPGGGRD